MLLVGGMFYVVLPCEAQVTPRCCTGGWFMLDTVDSTSMSALVKFAPLIYRKPLAIKPGCAGYVNILLLRPDTLPGRKSQ